MKIENIDIGTVYSAFLLEDSYKSIFEFPSMKKPAQNDWFEYDGIDVDLTEVFFESRDVTLEILISSLKYESFLTFLKSKTKLTVYFDEVDLTLSLRFVKASGINYPNGIFAMTVKFTEDIPVLIPATVQTNLNAYNYDFLIDGINVNTFGIVPLEKTFIEIDESLELKELLELSNKFMSGSVVVQQNVKRKERSTQLEFLMKGSLSEFKASFNNFFSLLTKPNERTITYNGKSYKFYYEKSNIENWIFDSGKVWCSFTVNIILI